MKYGIYPIVLLLTVLLSISAFSSFFCMLKLCGAI